MQITLYNRLDYFIESCKEIMFQSFDTFFGVDIDLIYIVDEHLYGRNNHGEGGGITAHFQR
jgi:hypothetical protein